MRIISDFHDYYDSVQKLGQDATLIYLRKTSEVPTPIHLLAGTTHEYNFGTKYVKYRDVLASQIIVGFCGKLYPLLSVSLYIPGNNDYTDCICYSHDDVRDFFKAHLRKDAFSEYMAAKHRRWFKTKYISWRHKEVIQYFEEASLPQLANKFEYIFIQNRVPIYVWHKRGNWHNRPPEHLIIYNAPLKDLQFERIMPPYQAYQAIAQYLSNFAAPSKPIPPIDDVTLAEAKGYDKYSFRKDPSKPKK